MFSAGRRHQLVQSTSAGVNGPLADSGRSCRLMSGALEQKKRACAHQVHRNVIETPTRLERPAVVALACDVYMQSAISHATCGSVDASTRGNPQLSRSLAVSTFFEVSISQNSTSEPPASKPCHFLASQLRRVGPCSHHTMYHRRTRASCITHSLRCRVCKVYIMAHSNRLI